MRSRTGFQDPVVATALAILLAAFDGAPARASGQGNSGTGASNSSESSGSSKGSGDSSNSSNDSSKSSSDSSKSSSGSSKDSDNSTQNSPKNSSDYTTNGSTDWTTHSHGAHVFSIALAVVAIGATVAGVVLKDRSHQEGPLQTAALAGFMRRQHALLLHDISTADGPVLEAWAHDLRLTPAERARLQRALDGSAEQGLLIDALDGTIDEKQARSFGVAFFRVTDRALGRTRTQALVARAMTAGRRG